MLVSRGCMRGAILPHVIVEDKGHRSQEEYNTAQHSILVAKSVSSQRGKYFECCQLDKFRAKADVTYSQREGILDSSEYLQSNGRPYS